MKTRILGDTNLSITEIGVGCWAMGGGVSNLGMGAGWDDVQEDKVLAGLTASAESGVNFYDTANVYGLGKSERLLSTLWRNRIVQRQDVIVASKLGYFQGCSEHGYDILNMQQQLEMSLRNLNTDYIDVYFFHHLDFGENDQYLEGALAQMKKFQEQGKIRHIGLRGPHRFSILRKREIVPIKNEYSRFLGLFERINPAVIGVRYNMISPTFDKTETDIFEWASSKNVGVITYKTLGQGLLLDKYDPQNPPEFSELDHRNRKLWFRAKGLTILKDKIERLRNYFGISSMDGLVELAIAYSLYKKSISSVLVGFKTRQQLLASLSSSKELNESDVRFIQEQFKDINLQIGDFIQLQ